jgi:hypothetical protein
MVPTDMATARVGDRDFIVLGSAANSGESGAISVMELRDSGALLPVDHVTDTPATRFGNLLALEVVTVDGRTYVLAAGGDGGITLFTLLPDGRLHLLDVMASRGGGLGATSRRWKAGGTASRCGLRNHGGEAGIAAFTVSLADQGLTLTAPDRAGRRRAARPTT